MSFPVNFRFISVEISTEKNFFGQILSRQKIRLWISGEGLWSYFWAIVIISAFISILDDFGNLLPARTVTVNGIY